ncbi:MAG: response regulator [Firmicutes bacterium]|nr:response regulator [Bacillota bacterium]
MNETPRLLIAEGYGLSREKLYESLSRLGYAVYAAADGGQALALIDTLKPDALVLSLTLPVYDGYGVLEVLSVRPLARYPLIIATSSMGESSLARALSLGADEAVPKPVTPERIDSLLRSLPACRISKLSLRHAEKREATVRRLLGEIGMAERLKGFSYLARAAALVSTDDRLLRQATGYLYPMIGSTCGASGNSVERAVRHAIESTWTRGNMEVLHHVFGNSIDPQRGKPTNSECIAMLVQRLWVATT